MYAETLQNLVAAHLDYHFGVPPTLAEIIKLALMVHRDVQLHARLEHAEVFVAFAFPDGSSVTYGGSEDM